MPDYRIHHSCKFVKGHQAYFIYDLQRCKGYYASLAVGDYLCSPGGKLTDPDAHREELDELLAKEIIYTPTNTSYRYIVPGGRQESAELISNLIVDYADNTYRDGHNAGCVLGLVEHFCIRHLQVIIPQAEPTQHLHAFLAQFTVSMLVHIELVFLHQEPGPELIQTFCADARVQSIMIVSASEEILRKQGKVLHVSDRLYMKGAHPVKFTISRQLYDESQEHHTYFHQKMHLDAEGGLGNAPEYNKRFINLFACASPTAIEPVVNSAAFRKYWHVRKEECLVCKDCEFRHMCVDTRLPYKTRSGLWAHREPCNYNPYTNTWQLPA